MADLSSLPSEQSANDPATRVYRELLRRMGEAHPEPRLGATRRAVELLGDIHLAFPVIHITGTNGKTSTSRITESILRAYGLRTGLFTSPHLESFTERISIDGEPVSGDTVARIWDEITPFLTIVDKELTESGQLPLTFFEALTVLALACFADAPVGVAVIEVGMGGEWDSTNVVEPQVAVLTPIALDHTAQLGSTVAAIAATKSGIIKPDVEVVSATQAPEALAEIERAAELSEARLHYQGRDFDVESRTLAVGGQVLDIRGIAGRYHGLPLPLFGAHQAQNAAVAIAAVESFLGGGSHELSHEVLSEGLAGAQSPGRLQLVGIEPTVLVDAAHNPAGAETLAAALTEFFSFDEVAVVLGILADKDAVGIITALSDVATRFYATASDSARALTPDDVARFMSETAPEVTLAGVGSLEQVVEEARSWAVEAGAASGAKEEQLTLGQAKRAVVITGSITLVGQALSLAGKNGWRKTVGTDSHNSHDS